MRTYEELWEYINEDLRMRMWGNCPIIRQGRSPSELLDDLKCLPESNQLLKFKQFKKQNFHINFETETVWICLKCYTLFMERFLSLNITLLWKSL